MIFHKNCLLADNSHVIPYLVLSKIGKDVAKFVTCCSGDWRFKDYYFSVSEEKQNPKEEMRMNMTRDETEINIGQHVVMTIMIMIIIETIDADRISLNIEMM